MGSLATRRVSAQRTCPWRTALKLGRVSNLPTVWSNVIAATALAGGAPLATIVWIAAAVSLLYVGGMFLNDAFDREADAHERPDRPIPAGEVSAGFAFLAASVLIGAGVVLLAMINMRAGEVGAVLAGAIVLYDWHHRGNPLSPWVMGVCRALVYVAAAVAVTMTVSQTVLFAALALLAYVAGVTYTARLEAFDRLASLWPLALLAAPALLALPQLDPGPVAALALLAFLGCSMRVAQLLRRRVPGDVTRAIALLIAGIAVNDALFAATMGDAHAALACLACFAATLILQRYVPAS